MSEKKKKIVQHAEEKKPSQDSSKPLEVASEEATVASLDKEAVKTVEKLVEVPQVAKTMEKLVEIPQVDEDTKKMLAKAGFSWDSFVQAFNRMNSWAASVEVRFGAISKNLEEAPQKVVEALKAEALKAQTEMAQKMQQAAQAQGSQQGGGGGLASLAPLLQLLGSGGGGSNPMQDQMMQKMFEKTMQGMDLSNALTKAMIIKLAPSLAEELTKTIVATGA